VYRHAHQAGARSRQCKELMSVASAPPRAPPRPSIASPPPTPSDLTLCVTPSRPQLAAIAAPRPGATAALDSAHGGGRRTRRVQ
jgi:hypothetical protein